MLKTLTSFELETVVLQVTTKCPYNCPQCYMKRGDADMPIDVAKNVIDQAVNLGARAVQITGGEPLAYPYLFEVVEYASSVGLKSLLATSGYNCSDQTYAHLKSIGLTAICVSINGISEKSNSMSRTPFEESLCAIKMAQNYGLLCFLNVVVTDDNVQELSVLGEYAQRRGVVGVNILHPVSSYGGEYVPKFSIETLNAIAQTVNSSPDFFYVEGCHREYWEHVSGTKFSCRDIGKTTYFVNVDGSVSPCSKMMRYKYRSLLQMLEKSSDWECGCL